MSIPLMELSSQQFARIHGLDAKMFWCRACGSQNTVIVSADRHGLGNSNSFWSEVAVYCCDCDRSQSVRVNGRHVSFDNDPFRC